MAEKDVSVALSGSGFRLGTHIGALQAILDNGYTITEIAGTSGGSIVASLYAVGFSPKLMLNMLLNAPLSDFLDWNISLIVARQALCDGLNLLKWLQTYLGVNTVFANALIPLTVLASDLNKYGSFVFSKILTPNANVAEACRASCAIPVVYTPVIVGGAFLVDGGVCDDLPVNYLTKPVKFAIDLFEPSNPLTMGYDVFTVMGRLIDTIIQVNNEAQLDQAPGTVPIKITTPPGLTLDTKLTALQIQQLYDLGYEATNVIISKL